MSENGKGDRRDVAVNSFDVLKEYDVLMHDILEDVQRVVSGVEVDLDELVLKISKALDTKSFEEVLPAQMGQFFEHDAVGFQNQIVAFLGFMKNDLDVTNRMNLRIDDLKDQVRILKGNWECYRLVLEDLILRTDASTTNRLDSGKPIENLIESLVFRAKEKCSGRHLEIATSPDLGELKKIKLANPYGFIFNFLQNCFSNAVDTNVKASKFKLSISIDGDNCIFEFSDNGIGMSDDIQKKIWRKGFSGKNGRGLGLADVPERASGFGSSASVESSPNSNPGGEEWATKFVLKAPILKE